MNKPSIEREQSFNQSVKGSLTQDFFTSEATSQPLLAKYESKSFSLDGNPQTKKKFSIRNFFKQFSSKVGQIKRRVYLNGIVEPENQQSNKIKNSKYNFFTFLPLVLYEQFHQFINLFYLGLTISQFIDLLVVGYLIDYLGPLILVVSLSLLKELYDDIKRHSRDRAINAYEYKLFPSGRNIKSGDLKVGHIIEINMNERIPADLVVLKCENDDGTEFLRTDQLDGETDWKLRKAVKLTQKDPTIEGLVKCPAPSESIYTFNGLFDTLDESFRESLSLENTMWANTVLASGKILGLVIYTGRETRMSMNSRSPKTKSGKIDNEINRISILLFIMMLSLSFLVMAFSKSQWNVKEVLVMTTRYLILLSNIIPISMRVNLEFAKLSYCYRIMQDKDIEGTITRNSNIPESLGRIQYLLTDKTGTLTQNDMIFKRISLQQASFTNEDLNEMKQIVNDLICQEQKGQKDRDRDSILKDLIITLAVCHNVTPIEGGNYQASSPDEIALVKFASTLGLELTKRDQNTIHVKHPLKKLSYQILNIFPFSSERKRMGILLYSQETDQYIFYLKGADSVMKKFVKETSRGFIDEECENLAREGLRTLVISQKILKKQDYIKFKNFFDRASECMDDRERKIEKAISYLERNMEFLGITGVEDKLQENVCPTLENIRNAGINIWMLTGDKIETAICIAISSGIKEPHQEIFLLKEIIDETKLQMHLQQFETKSYNSILVIDGVSLQTAIEFKKDLFFQISSQSSSVVCCRCSPTQKALVTENLKHVTKKVIACIGDGGNDVGMIQSADVGIGIEGKEGKQAALASDFSIQQFKYLNELLLWHGRLSYKRSALLGQFVIHRGLIISIIQAVFMFSFYFLSISIFSGMLVLGYATIFTMFPVFSIIFDEDVAKKIALQYPPLYKSLQKGRYLNSKTFLIWVWKATYQGVVIMIISFFFFKNIFLEISTVAFTALIFTEYAMVFSELNSLHIVQIISSICSTLVYITAIYLFPSMFLVSDISWEMIGKIIIIVFLLSWGPLFLLTFVLRKIYPSDFQKIMKNVKKKVINTDFGQ